MRRTPHSVRQVPCDAPSRRGLGCGPQERIWPLASRDRSFIKGQKYTLLSHNENLTLNGRSYFRRCFKLISGSTSPICSRNPSGSFGTTNARPGRGASSITGKRHRWQRLKPYEKFAAMIDRHWDGIAAYCRPENKVSLGFVEGSTTKSGSFNAVPMVCAMSNTYALRSLPACFRSYSSGASIHRSGRR